MNNIARIQDAIRGGEMDAVMITSATNRLFATGFTSSAGIALVTVSGAWFLTDSRYEEAAKNAISTAEVLLVTRDRPYSIIINELIASGGIKTIGFEDEDITFAQHSEWSEKLDAALVPAQTTISNLRAVKSEDELKMLIDAQRISEKAFEDILPLVKTGITERELAAELLYRMRKNGADCESFDPIIVSGKRTSMPHGVPEDHVIGDGFLTIDFGVRYRGWCSDTTRTLCVGKPTDEMIRVYDTVLRAQNAGIAAARAGVRGCDIDKAARDVIADAGYGEYFGHGFGHGLGLEVHETPNASPSSENELPEGAVISAEPGIYIPGRFGVRIEDVLFITRDGNRNITNLTKELIIL